MKKNLLMMASSTLIWLTCIFFSLAAVILIVLDINKPAYYNLLYLLPLSFAVLSILFFGLYKHILNNISVAVILILFFVRMVISPLFMSLGNYAGTILSLIHI